MAERNAGEICHTCGGTGNLELVVICQKCKKISTHVYCLKVLPPEIPEQWYCEECIDHKQASNDPKGNSQLDKPSLNRAQFESVPPTKARAPPQTGKVKFISERDITLLNNKKYYAKRSSDPVMSSGSGDSEPAKKPGRGPTKLTHVVNMSNKEVQFDKLGRPIINEQTTSYPTHLGMLVRAQVSIRHRAWSDVPDHIKKKIWHEIRLAWNLPDGDVMQKEVTMRMAVAFRKFRNRLYNDYMKEDKTPFKDYTAITQEDWEEFVKYHQSDEFEELSKIGKANQSNNMYPHFLGSRGYSGEKFQKRLKEALMDIASKEGSSSDLSSQGFNGGLSQDQLVDMSVQHRHVPWKLAREKVSDGASIYPNPETEAMIKTIDEQQKAFDQGMMTSDRYDDILGSSLPNREHPGRVRGVGSLAGIKKTYQGAAKRKRQRSSESEANIQERIAREVEEKVEERIKSFLEQQEALMRQMAMLMDQHMDTGNTLVTSPRVVQSSCPSVQPPHFLDLIEEECKCKLYLVRDGQKIQVAVGTILPSPQGSVIHSRPIPSDHARVMVDDYVAGEDDTPVPIPNGEVGTLRSARSSFTAWPKNLISLDEEPRKKSSSYKWESVHTEPFYTSGKSYKKFDGPRDAE